MIYSRTMFVTFSYFGNSLGKTFRDFAFLIRIKSFPRKTYFLYVWRKLSGIKPLCFEEQWYLEKKKTYFDYYYWTSLKTRVIPTSPELNWIYYSWKDAFLLFPFLLLDNFTSRCSRIEEKQIRHCQSLER